MIPGLIYGTAWKEAETERLVLEALGAGFRAVDTANQRKHYFEEGAGKAVRRFLEDGEFGREELFLQTKFTFAGGQDSRKPYDERAPYAEQVRQSLESSLEHLGVSYVDSFLLHGPFAHGLGAPDREVWAAMGDLRDAGKAHAIGVSNFSRDQLEGLLGWSMARPDFVQNRCYARTGWDRETRELCRESGIAYQGFSLLTANVAELMQEPVSAIARAHGKTVPQVVFRFCRQVGILALTGTTNERHMREDLDLDDFTLSEPELKALERIGG